MAAQYRQSGRSDTVKSGLIHGLHIAVTKSNWVRHCVSHFAAHLLGIKFNTYRWKDYAISPRRALVELVATAFILIALAIALVPYDDQVRDKYFQIAGSLSLHTEEAPQLANVARPRVPRGFYGP